jgi:hypothetical protein
MIYRLRKRHFINWVLLAVTLPILFAVALMAIPKEEFGTTIQSQNPDLTEVASDHILTIRTPSNNNGFELTLKEALKAPAVLVYLSSNNSPESIEEAILLGQIDSRGVYYYSYKLESGQSVLLYDPIKQQVIHKLSL